MGMRVPNRKSFLLLFFKKEVLACLLLASPALANPVGERHRVTTTDSAILRNDDHTPQLRVTFWYPAQAGTQETPLTIGPPSQPLFLAGSAAAGAPIAAGRFPVLLLSHGFGGTARVMAWLGTALARDGYIVIAVDHPGNNAIDPMTGPGALLVWDRADDLRAALLAAGRDAVIGPHLDLSRLGATGFSAGGFTALAAGGAAVDHGHLQTFCAANPDDGVCAPQHEFPVTAAQRARLLAAPRLQADIAHADGSHAVPGVRAVFVVAPAIIQALSPASLAHLAIPVDIMLGDADRVAPPATNGLAAAHAIPGAALQVLPGVGHYDFLATCTASGREEIPICDTAVPQADTHAAAIAAATAFFDRTLKP
jgi:predicted dienelactone hydrolase